MKLNSLCSWRGVPGLALLLATVAGLYAQPPQVPEERWSEAQANAWYAAQPWLVGADFLPSTAINQLEMWQADTFDPITIDRELGWAAGHRHEHHARLPAQSALGAGPQGF